MKAKVIKSFVDKNTGKLVTSGSDVDFEDSRIESLVKNGFVIRFVNKPTKKGLRAEMPGGGA
jgi:hypothetical protein